MHIMGAHHRVCPDAVNEDDENLHMSPDAGDHCDRWSRVLPTER